MAYFIVWELAERNPLLDLRLLLRRNFLIGSLGLSLSFMLMYGLLSLLLVRLQVVAGYTSFLAGSVLLPLVFLAKPMATLMHRVVHRFDARLLASINMLLFALYCEWNSRYDFFGRNSYFDQPLWSQVLEGFCLGGLFVPLTTIFISGLTPRRQIQAVELGGMLRVLGGSIASPLFGAFWDRRNAFHLSQLLQSIPSHAGWSQQIIGQLQDAGIKNQLLDAQLGLIAGQHAAILALEDSFKLASWLFILLAALVWLAKPVESKTSISAKENLNLTVLEDLVEEP
jgi:DHA2 family multidrug resistance protein